MITHTRLEGGKKIAPSADLPPQQGIQEGPRVWRGGGATACSSSHRHRTFVARICFARRSNPPRSSCGTAEPASRSCGWKFRSCQHRGLQTRFLPVPSRGNEFETVEIHGERWNREYVREIVKAFRKFNWHWNRCAWKESDVVARINDGSISRDLSLAADSAIFRLVAGGWTKDECLICRWELFESKNDPEHGIGYTNGRDWLCTECYDKFWEAAGIPFRLRTPRLLSGLGRARRPSLHDQIRRGPQFSLQD